jgi:hypothetical protein
MSQAGRYPYLPQGARPVGRVYQGQHALGANPYPPPPGVQPMGSPTDSPGEENDPRWMNFEKIPAFYTISVNLGGAANDVAPGSTQLRPEPFILKRITWAAQGDTYPYTQAEPGYSLQGRAVTVTWADEFTKFLGNQPALISSLFGDSNGFLDVPRGALFQGKQVLSINLTRLHWPSAETPQTTRFDFVFQGLGLLPKGVAQSGSAG